VNGPLIPGSVLPITDYRSPITCLSPITDHLADPKDEIVVRFTTISHHIVQASSLIQIITPDTQNLVLTPARRIHCDILLTI
jgi:hypothetical protein